MADNTGDSQQDQALFSGRFSTASGLERMRMRLRDLSSNNRLLNYRFPKGRALRVVDTPPNPLFERVYVENKLVSVLPVPDPPHELYEERNGLLRKPDVREYAEYQSTTRC